MISILSLYIDTPVPLYRKVKQVHISNYITNTFIFQSKNRIQTTVDRNQQQITNIKYKINDLYELKAKIDANIEIEKLTNNEMHINELQNSCELEYHKQKVSNFKYVLSVSSRPVGIFYTF